MKKPIVDLLSCPNCGNIHTQGFLCNLRCRREYEAMGIPQTERQRNRQRFGVDQIVREEMARQLASGGGLV